MAASILCCCATILLFATISLCQLHPVPQPRAPTPASATAPIPLFLLTISSPQSLDSQDADTKNQIRNTMAHYPLAIDGKNFAALDLVFAADAVANYSTPLNVLTGLPQIEAVLEQALAPVLSQHALSTQVIEIEKGGETAKSVTYFTASQFGMGNMTGKVSKLDQFVGLEHGTLKSRLPIRKTLNRFSSNQYVAGLIFLWPVPRQLGTSGPRMADKASKSGIHGMSFPGLPLLFEPAHCPQGPSIGDVSVFTQ